MIDCMGDIAEGTVLGPHPEHPLDWTADLETYMAVSWMDQA